MNKLREMSIFTESEEISDLIWRDVSLWDEFSRDTIGKDLVNSMDAINTNIAESYSHKSRQGRMHYLYSARGPLFRTLILLEKAVRRELCEAEEIALGLERLMPQINQYIETAEHMAD